VLTKVATGEADAGLVYRTDATGSTAVRAIPTAGAETVVNRYPIAVVSDSANPEAASAFIAFVQDSRSQRILSSFGFGAP
jgi:molybdate transport system substrate-binding protein